MEHRRLLVACALAVVGVTVAGCIEDLERRHVEAEWEADLDVGESVFREVHGAPSMVAAQGAVSLPADANLTVTGIQGELARENTSIPLQALRVRSGEGTQKAPEAEGELELSDGEQVTITFAPADDAPRRANPDHVWNASVEVQWRYRDGGAFDAGRLELEQNVTPSRIAELGVGVVEREEGQAHRLVFEAIDAEELPEQTPVEVLQVGGGSVETLERSTARVEASEGTARLALAGNVTVPEGSGYLVFRLSELGGTATTGLRASEEPIPVSGGVALAAIAVATLWAAVRRRE